MGRGSAERDKEGLTRASKGKLSGASVVVTTALVDQNVRENMAGVTDPRVD
jgi:hypothetical protein